MQTTDTQKNFSWSFLKKFKIESIHSAQEWQPITRLVEKSRQAIIPYIQECQKLESLWEERLQPLCGIQTNFNWAKFRPLRRNREEDWSDWLAWLLETSQTGILADSLFAKYMNCQAESFASPDVGREVCIEGRRADIVISWKTILCGSFNFKASFVKYFQLCLRRCHN